MRLIERIQETTRSKDDRPYRGLEVTIYSQSDEESVESHVFDAENGLVSATVGKDPSHDIYLPEDSDVSSNHATLRLQDEAVMDALSGGHERYRDTVILEEYSDNGTVYLGTDFRPQVYHQEDVPLKDVDKTADVSTYLYPGASSVANGPQNPFSTMPVDSKYAIGISLQD